MTGSKSRTWTVFPFKYEKAGDPLLKYEISAHYIYSLYSLIWISSEINMRGLRWCAVGGGLPGGGVEVGKI